MADLTASVEEARVERFCLIAGLSILTQMLEEDATALAGAPACAHSRKTGISLGSRPKGAVGFHRGKVEMERPRVRSGLSKTAVARRFKALTQARLEAWMGSDLSARDLLVIQT